VSKNRFLSEFGIDYDLLHNDERYFFYESYSKILSIRKQVLEQNNVKTDLYFLIVTAFTTEMTKVLYVGEQFKRPFRFELISGLDEMIALSVYFFDEFQAKKVGLVLAIDQCTLLSPRRVFAHRGRGICLPDLPRE
jgi:hypothetical protein